MLTSQQAKLEKFEQQLRRLKAALGLDEDQDVARRLGMHKAAFSARKMRGSFPVDRVKALALDEPNLRLDVDYILTGVSQELERRMRAVGRTTQITKQIEDPGVRYLVQAQVMKALVDELDAREQRLVGCFRQTDERGKVAILRVAESLASYE